MKYKVVQIHCLRCKVDLSIELRDKDGIYYCPCCGANSEELQFSKQKEMTAASII